MRSYVAGLVSLSLALPLFAQSGGRSGTIVGTVTDPTGAVIPGATITLHNPVSGFALSTTSDAAGHYQFNNLPYNQYHLVIAATGFNTISEDASIQASVTVTLKETLVPGAAAQNITVESSDLVESDTTFHTDLDRKSFDKLPLESQSSGLSSLVTLSSPGVAADSNGLFHGLGDHASNTFSDRRPVRSPTSSPRSSPTSSPSNAVQSISGYRRRSARRIRREDQRSSSRSPPGLDSGASPSPQADITTSYGTFGAATASHRPTPTAARTGGNFFELDGLNTGRFLDAPEFSVFHDKGNEQNVFDRIDRQISTLDSVHLNLTYSRSWFQTPNTYDNLNVQNVVSAGSSANPVFGNVGDADQHSKIETWNIAPSYTHVLNDDAVFNLGLFARKDAYNYYPSGNPLADLGPANLQRESIAQSRSLLNTGAHSDLSYVKGRNTAKLGALYEQTFLREHDQLGIVDSTLNTPLHRCRRRPDQRLHRPRPVLRRRSPGQRRLQPRPAALRPHPRRRQLHLLRPL